MKSQLHTHLMENNPESQGFLEENEQKFSDQCLKVYRLLLGGIRLSVVDAIGHGISSLPRRILDLKERNGITTIKDEWGRRYYEWEGSQSPQSLFKIFKLKNQTP